MTFQRRRRGTHAGSGNPRTAPWPAPVRWDSRRTTESGSSDMTRHASASPRHVRTDMSLLLPGRNYSSSAICLLMDPQTRFSGVRRTMATDPVCRVRGPCGYFVGVPRWCPDSRTRRSRRRRAGARWRRNRLGAAHGLCRSGVRRGSGRPRDVEGPRHAGNSAAYAGKRVEIHHDLDPLLSARAGTPRGAYLRVKR